MSGGAWAFAALSIFAADEGADPFDPAAVELAALIECRADAPTYYGFAEWLVEQRGAVGVHGMREAASPDALFVRYQLDRPVRVWGREAREVLFDSSGPLAVLDGADAGALADELRMSKRFTVPGAPWFRAERVASERSEVVDGTTIRDTVKARVWNRSSHPGRALAGCSYVVETD